MQYRIITNGEKYRVQVKTDATDNNWNTMQAFSNGAWQPKNFPDLESARAYVAERMEMYQGETWEVVE